MLFCSILMPRMAAYKIRDVDLLYGDCHKTSGVTCNLGLNLIALKGAMLRGCSQHLRVEVVSLEALLLGI